jgi:N-methylhydantoinase B/oxoprolinase/acetone carboxylase alpha subunit
MSLSLLTQHRVERPYGAAGGEPGQPGRQRLVRATGEVQELPSIAACEVAVGDRLVLETPGGGGWGKEAPAARPESAATPESATTPESTAGSEPAATPESTAGPESAAIAGDRAAGTPG